MNRGIDQRSRRDLAFTLSFQLFQIVLAHDSWRNVYYYPHSAETCLVFPLLSLLVAQLTSAVSGDFLAPPSNCTQTPVPSHYRTRTPWPVPMSFCTLNDNILYLLVFILPLHICSTTQPGTSWRKTVNHFTSWLGTLWFRVLTDSHLLTVKVRKFSLMFESII